MILDALAFNGSLTGFTRGRQIFIATVVFESLFAATTFANAFFFSGCRVVGMVHFFKAEKFSVRIRKLFDVLRSNTLNELFSQHVYT